jgi:hypothetical protein
MLTVKFSLGGLGETPFEAEQNSFAGHAGYGALTHLTRRKPLPGHPASAVSLMFYFWGFGPKKTKKPAKIGGFVKKSALSDARTLLLPGALLVAVRFEALPAFVFRHLETSFLFQIAHG